MVAHDTSDSPSSPTPLAPDGPRNEVEWTVVREQAARLAIKEAAQHAPPLAGGDGRPAGAGATPADVATVVIEQGVAAAGAVAGVVALFTETGTELEVVRATGHDQDPYLTLPPPARRAAWPVPEAARLGTPIWLDSRLVIGERFSDLLPSLPEVNVQAVAALPLLTLRTGDRRSAPELRRGGRLTPTWRAFLLALASQCALALERAHSTRGSNARASARRPWPISSVCWARPSRDWRPFCPWSRGTRPGWWVTSPSCGCCRTMASGWS